MDTELLILKGVAMKLTFHDIVSRFRTGTGTPTALPIITWTSVKGNSQKQQQLQIQFFAFKISSLLYLLMEHSTRILL